MVTFVLYLSSIPFFCLHFVFSLSSDYEPGTEITKHEDIDCYGQALPLSSGSKVIYQHVYRKFVAIVSNLSISSQTVFRHSICKASHWTESFIATESEYHIIKRLQQSIVFVIITYLSRVVA